MSDDKKPFNLNMHTARLLMREPFFAALSRRIDKIASTAIPTAGVRVNPDSAQFEMLYNPEFFAQLSDDHKLGILKHEFYHLIFEHVTSRKPDDGSSGSITSRWIWLSTATSPTSCQAKQTPAQSSEARSQ